MQNSVNYYPWSLVPCHTQKSSLLFQILGNAITILFFVIVLSLINSSFRNVFNQVQNAYLLHIT